MTPALAKRAVAQWLRDANLGPFRLTAQTVSFSDLARASCVFVTVHGWTPDPHADDLRSYARAQGFRVVFS